MPQSLFRHLLLRWLTISYRRRTISIINTTKLFQIKEW
jgi:hypothetical protein